MLNSWSRHPENGQNNSELFCVMGRDCPGMDNTWKHTVPICVAAPHLDPRPDHSYCSFRLLSGVACMCRGAGGIATNLEKWGRGAGDRCSAQSACVCCICNRARTPCSASQGSLFVATVAPWAACNSYCVVHSSCLDLLYMYGCKQTNAHVCSRVCR